MGVVEQHLLDARPSFASSGGGYGQGPQARGHCNLERVIGSMGDARHSPPLPPPTPPHRLTRLNGPCARPRQRSASARAPTPARPTAGGNREPTAYGPGRVPYKPHTPRQKPTMSHEPPGSLYTRNSTNPQGYQGA
eukprot:scaffold89684_cov30-Tisochrysis_lutea.AAC.3